MSTAPSVVITETPDLAVTVFGSPRPRVTVTNEDAPSVVITETPDLAVTVFGSPRPSVTLLDPTASNPTLTRSTVSATTGSLTNLASGDFTMATGRVAQLLAVTLSHASWLRIYRSAAQRTADTRTSPGGTFQAQIDLGDAKPYAEIVTTGAAQTVISNPVPEIPGDGSGLIYVRLRNQSGGTVAVTADLSILKLES